MALVISEAPHALDLTGGRVLGRGETANVDLSNHHEATYYDEGWLTIIDGSSPPPPPTPPESIQVAGSPFQTGQVIYYDGMEWVVLNPGDAGEVLMTHGVNAIPEWVPIDVSMFAFDPATQSELDVHAADTTSVHGIANTADILYKTLADAKGDIFVATAPDTLVRLPVGADNTFLKANSAQPLGMEWATVPAPDLTPYAPKASPVFTGTIGVPLYTLATRPAATAGAGKLVYVTDAAAGTRLQTSDGTTWSGGSDLSTYAPLASPSFTGTVGLPTYTIATRPAASAGVGKVIYVSDATQGQKLQTSDGSIWSTVAIVLDALSASTPDKIAWEYPAGTDVVELYGLETLAGTFVVSFTDPATTDQRAAKWDDYAGGALSWVDPSGQVNSRWGYYCQRFPAAVKTSLVPSQTGSLRVVSRIGIYAAGSNQASVCFSKTGDETSMLNALWNDSTGKVELRETKPGFWDNLIVASTGTGPTGQRSDRYLLLERHSDGTITAQCWNGDPDAGGTMVCEVANRTLTGNPLSNFASGIGIRPSICAQGVGTPAWNNDIRVYLASSEQRDLMVAVTPAGGTRTVRRMFGSSGSGTLRSDFAQMVAIGQSQALQVPAFTLATRPPASGSGGAAIFVSDATAGTRLQYSDGTNWIATAPIDSPTFTGTPAAPTQAAADSSTKLATTAYADRLAQQVFAINTQAGTAYTTVLADAGKVIESNNAAAMTLTIPPNSAVAYPIGTRMRGVRLGAGTLTIVQGAGVVLRNKIEAAGTTNRTIPAQYGEWQLYKRATDEWVLTGDIA